MAYQVIARRYRPQNFDQVVGQPIATETLKNAILLNRVHHAYLFTGTRGIGKTSVARIFAKAINCRSGMTVTPCDTCDICNEIRGGYSDDVIEIDGASNRGIDEIRELRNRAKYLPIKAKTKIYIIDEVHMLTKEAFNALLKTLEEPPPHVMFIFATTEVSKIPTTILSRCERLDFKKMSEPDMVLHLSTICKSDSLSIDARALSLIARQARGSMRDAQSILDQVASYSGNAPITEKHVSDILGISNSDDLFDLVNIILSSNSSACVEKCALLNQNGQDFVQLFDDLLCLFRDIFVMKLSNTHVSIHPDNMDRLISLRELIDKRSYEEMNQIMTTLINTYPQLTRSDIPHILAEITLLKLTQITPITKIETLIDELQALKTEGPLTKANSVPRPVAPVKSENHQPIAKTHLNELSFSDFLTHLESKHPNLYAKVEECSILQLNDGMVTLGIQASNVFAEDLKSKEYQDRIEKQLADHFKHPIHIEVTLLNDEPTEKEHLSIGAKKQQDKIAKDIDKKNTVLKNETLKEAIKLFDGKIVNVYDSEK